MPRQEQYLVQYEGDMTFRTVNAFSILGAAKEFVKNYAPEVGTRFRLKQRGSSDGWAMFSRTKVGVRRVE